MRALENADRIREAPARLPTASRADLTAEWLRLYGCAPPSKLRRELLVAAIAYRFVSQKTDRARLYPVSATRSAGWSAAAMTSAPPLAAAGGARRGLQPQIVRGRVGAGLQLAARTARGLRGFHSPHLAAT